MSTLRIQSRILSPYLDYKTFKIAMGLENKSPLLSSPSPHFPPPRDTLTSHRLFCPIMPLLPPVSNLLTENRRQNEVLELLFSPKVAFCSSYLPQQAVLSTTWLESFLTPVKSALFPSKPIQIKSYQPTVTLLSNPFPASPFPAIVLLPELSVKTNSLIAASASATYPFPHCTILNK